MTEKGEVKHAVLEPDQTMRFRALELAVLADRELRTINIGDGDAGEAITVGLLKRADAFWGYIKDATVPEGVVAKEHE